MLFGSTDANKAIRLAVCLLTVTLTGDAQLSLLQVE